MSNTITSSKTEALGGGKQGAAPAKNQNKKTMITRKTVKVDTDRSEPVKMSIGAPIWETGYMTEDNLVRTGVYLMSLYWLPRKRVLVARQYSIWDNGKGEHCGEHFLAVDPAALGDDWAINAALDAAGVPDELRGEN